MNAAEDQTNIDPLFLFLCGCNPGELEAIILYCEEYKILAKDDLLWEKFLVANLEDVMVLRQKDILYYDIYQAYPHYRRTEWLDFDHPGREILRSTLTASVQPTLFKRTNPSDRQAMALVLHKLLNDEKFLNLLSEHRVKEKAWVRWMGEVDGKEATHWISTLKRYPRLQHPDIASMLWELAFYHVTFSTQALCSLVDELSLCDPYLVQPENIHILFHLLRKRAVTEAAIYELRFFLTALRVTQRQVRLSMVVVQEILVVAATNLREAKKLVLHYHQNAAPEPQKPKRPTLTLVK